MKYYKVLGCLFFSVFLFSCQQKHNLEIHIPEIENDTIYIENYKVSSLGEDPILDTVYGKNGKFIYNSKINEPTITQIIPRKVIEKMTSFKGVYIPNEKSILLILKPEDKIIIKGSLSKKYLKYEALGSLINKDFSNFRNEYATPLIEKTKLELLIDSLRSKNEKSSKINALFRDRKEKSSAVKAIQLNFIKNNLDKDLSAYYLVFQPLDTLGKYYPKLSKKVTEGLFKNLLSSEIIRFKKFTNVKKAKSAITIGKKAPTFSLKNTSGETIKIDYKKQKYTVLDFWGSWCAPCIAGFPKMKNYFKKYNNRINFIGIACNDTEVKWKKAVEKYNLKWENLINSTKLEYDVSTKFAVTDYPTKIIVNSSGIIEAIFEGEGKDFYEKLDNLFTK